MIKLLITSLLTIVMHVTAAWSSEHITGVLTLEECFRILESQNPQLQAARESISAAQARHRIAVGQKYPNISAGASYSVVSDVMEMQIPGQTIPIPPPAGPIVVPERRIPFGDKDTADLKLTLGLPIYSGGSISESIQLADVGIELAKVEYQSLRQDLRCSLRSLYLQFLKADKAIEIVQEDINRNERHLDEVKNRLKQGMAIDLDVLDARIALGKSQQELLTRSNEKEQARLALLSLLHLPKDSPMIFSSQGWDHPPDQTEIPDQDAPLEQRSEIRKITLEISAAHLRKSLSVSAQRPLLYFSTSGHVGRPGIDPVTNEWMTYATAGLNLDFTLFRGGALKSDIEEKHKTIDILQNQKNALERQITFERQTARLTLSTAQGQLELAEQILDNAQERFRVVESMWRQGVATETTFQDAREALTKSQLSRAVSLIDYHLALADIIRANGEIGDIP